MKSAGIPLLALALAGSLAADEPAPPKPAKTSSRLIQEIQATLPKYSPPSPKPLNQPKELENDPDILALPKITVREKQPPRIIADELLTERELNKKLAREYRDSLSGLDAVLNRFTIPIFSASPAERGRALRDRRTFEDAHRIGEIHRQTDPASAKSLKADLEKSVKEMEWRNRPAGEGRAK